MNKKNSKKTIYTKPFFKILIAIKLILFISLLIYLNWSYARFFDYIGWKQLPNPNHQSFYSIESTGYPVSKLTYLAIGDSLTAGVGASSYQYTYPYLISQSIAEKGIEVENYNTGIPGATIRDITNPIQKEYYQRVKPQLITVMIGTNDSLNRIDLNEFNSKYRELIVELKRLTSNIYIINIPYLGSPKIINQPYPPLLDWQIQQYNLQIAQISQELSVPMIDLYSTTKQQFLVHSDLYSEDLFHPSDQGYLVWSKIITPQIRF